MENDIPDKEITTEMFEGEELPELPLGEDPMATHRSLRVSAMEATSA